MEKNLLVSISPPVAQSKLFLYTSIAMDRISVMLLQTDISSEIISSTPSMLTTVVINNNTQLSQNLSQRLDLVHRLSAYTDPPDTVSNIYINKIENQETFAISYI